MITTCLPLLLGLALLSPTQPAPQEITQPQIEAKLKELRKLVDQMPRGSETFENHSCPLTREAMMERFIASRFNADKLGQEISILIRQATVQNRIPAGILKALEAAQLSLRKELPKALSGTYSFGLADYRGIHLPFSVIDTSQKMGAIIVALERDLEESVARLEWSLNAWTGDYHYALLDIYGVRESGVPQGPFGWSAAHRQNLQTGKLLHARYHQYHEALRLFKALLRHVSIMEDGAEHQYFLYLVRVHACFKFDFNRMWIAHERLPAYVALRRFIDLNPPDWSDKEKVKAWKKLGEDALSVEYAQATRMTSPWDLEVALPTKAGNKYVVTRPEPHGRLTDQTWDAFEVRFHMEYSRLKGIAKRR